MASISDVKTKLQNANALGIANLTEQGVDISEDATTYDIMSAIAEISGSGGISYTSIVYNDDNTVTLTDKDGIIHTMSCTYEDDKLIGVTYDGKAIELTYDGDVLVQVGKTAVDMSNAPNEPKTTIKADSCVAEVILPVTLDTVTAEINGSIEVVGRAGLPIDDLIASIVGDGTVGSVLSVASDDFDVTKCDYQWYKAEPQAMTKYAHTPNVSDDGTQNGNYSNNYSNTKVVTIEGADELSVTLKYGTESLSYDWVSVYAGNHPDYTASSSGYIQKLGGTDAEVTFTVEGDSVTFAFRSDSSSVGSGYGYYAVVEGIGKVLTEISTEETYTVVGDENSIKCVLTGARGLIGTVTTDYLEITESEE